MAVVNGEANIFHNTWRTCRFRAEREMCGADSGLATPGVSATDSS